MTVPTPALPSGPADTGSAKDPPLFLGPAMTHMIGQAKLNPKGGKIAGPSTPVADSGVRTTSQAMTDWYSWTLEQQTALSKKLFALGYATVQSPTDIYGARDTYFKAMDAAAGYYKAGYKVTPMWVLDHGAGGNADTLKQRAQINPDGSITRTNSQVDLSSYGDVEAIATTALQQALGRDPTKAELNTYFDTIRAKEKAHPSVTTTTTDAGGNVHATSAGGFDQNDAQAYLKERLQNDPEYGKYQAGTTYFNAAMEALGAIGGA